VITRHERLKPSYVTGYCNTVRSPNTRVTGRDNGALRKTAFEKFIMQKIGLREGGRLRTRHHNP
jgi:hypothetical protein